MELTEQEKELIEAIRNYKRAYPHGAKNLKKYATDLFRELLKSKK